MTQGSNHLEQSEAAANFDLTCWYLNEHRVLELVGASSVADQFRQLRLLDATGDPLRRNVKLAILKDAVVGWLQNANPPTLGQLLIRDTLTVHTPFTLYTNFYCRGLPKIRKAIQDHRIPVPSADMYAKLEDLRPEWRVSLRFHHNHLTSTSSWSELSGQKRLFVFCAVTSIRDKTIEAIPWVIANPITNILWSNSLVGRQWSNRLEVFIDGMDSFAEVRRYRRKLTTRVLKSLVEVPECDVKQAFADIIGEPTVHKDWGGEQSDLFTSRLVVDQKRISTAFVFKGPARFRPLKMAGLGKNGDQIDRLFNEPADLLILQHCHEITQPVRAAMRAYAQQTGNPRLFCLIDGYDTVRLFRAYRKCGF